MKTIGYLANSSSYVVTAVQVFALTSSRVKGSIVPAYTNLFANPPDV